MSIRRRIAIAVLAVCAIASCTTLLSPERAGVRAYPASTQQRDGVFVNKRADQPQAPAAGAPAAGAPAAGTPAAPTGLRRQAGLWWRFLFDKPENTRPPGPIPVQPVSAQQLQAAPDGTMYRLGHSTILLKVGGRFWLTDPIFSERASPVQWAGPQRFHPPPLDIDDLPPIEAVILSHDHYDHLDHATVLRLAAKVGQFITPLGVGDRMIAWGIPPAKVRQLDWWQSVEVAGMQLTAVPAQHFSGRTLSDRNKTLWASWVMHGGGLRLFFSGDTGYHANFKTIGDRFGPFDVAMLEVGAYDPQWATVHMLPEQALQAYGDLRAKWLVPVHNGTFDLAFHAWDDPFNRIAALADERGAQVALPMMGEAMPLAAPRRGTEWWRQVTADAKRGNSQP